ncbi:hypothetical protein [Aestuariivirga sp.]|jgi:hypothetical protein|uniref:hypothetical protein n=1 Tax=Aestuariivirga sp. TaxID=2650926 RepID=UPI003783E7C3
MTIESAVQRLAREQIQKNGSMDIPGTIFALGYLFPSRARGEIQAVVIEFAANLQRDRLMEVEVPPTRLKGSCDSVAVGKTQLAAI